MYVGGLKSVEQLDCLDVLEPFPSEEVVAVPLPAVPFGETGRKPSCPLFEQSLIVKVQCVEFGLSYDDFYIGKSSFIVLAVQ